MEQRVVVSSFVLMSPKPQHLFARLKPRSTSIRSVLSLYAVLRSSGVGSFFGRPKAGPDIRIPLLLQKAVSFRSN